MDSGTPEDSSNSSSPAPRRKAAQTDRGRAYSMPHLYPPFWWWSTFVGATLKIPPVQKPTRTYDSWTPSRIQSHASCRRKGRSRLRLR